MRVMALMETRTELTASAFGKRIARGQSWVSEFKSGRRTTNDLRLVIAMARIFGVSVGYLIGETPTEPDAGAVTLLATYEAASPRDREVLLGTAATLRRAADKDSSKPKGRM
jgi:hypothetical protein